MEFNLGFKGLNITCVYFSFCKVQQHSIADTAAHNMTNTMKRNSAD